jgi:hypothetical protein
MSDTSQAESKRIRRSCFKSSCLPFKKQPEALKRHLIKNKIPVFLRYGIENAFSWGQALMNVSAEKVPKILKGLGVSFSHYLLDSQRKRRMI